MAAHETRIGSTHLARKALFRRGLEQGYLHVDEIEEALPPGALTPAERWLFYYSLRAAEVELVGEVPRTVSGPLPEPREAAEEREGEPAHH